MQRTSASSATRPGLTAALDSSSRSSSAVSPTSAPPSSTTVYNPGWHLCRDLRNMLIVSRGGRRAPRCCATRAAAPTAGSTSPAYDDYWGEHNIVVRKDARRHGARAAGRSSRRPELAPLVEQRKEAERTS